MPRGDPAVERKSKIASAGFPDENRHLTARAERGDGHLIPRVTKQMTGHASNCTVFKAGDEPSQFQDLLAFIRRTPDEIVRTASPARAARRPRREALA